MVEVLRKGEWIKVSSKDMTTAELTDKLSSILIDSDEFVTGQEKREWYAALDEAVRRLSSNDSSGSRSATNFNAYSDPEEARQAWLDDKENWDEFGNPDLDLYQWLYAERRKKNE